MTAANNLLQIQAIPIPPPHYTNDFMVCGILICTFILATVLSDRKHYFSQQLKNFFLPRENSIEGVRTTSIVYLRISMYIVSLFSTTLFLVTFAANKPLGTMEYVTLWITASAAITLFYILRILIFAATNRIFFDSSTTTMWEQSYACWTILSSIPLYLLSVIAVFFNLPSNTVLLMFTIGIGLLEMCLLYKAFHIFSAKKYGILQIFVYLCSLELMPLLVAGKALVLFM